MPRAKKDPLETTKQERQRTDTLNMRIDPKLKYLAEIAALEQQRTLSGFIGWAIRRALAIEALSHNDPVYRRDMAMDNLAQPLWNEALWDVDECDRFFLKATKRPDLLRAHEQRFWKLFLESGAPHHELSLKAFRNFWGSPHVDTTRLSAPTD